MRCSSHDQYVIPLPPRHSFPMPKFRALRELLLEEDVVAPAEISSPAQCAWDTLALAHERAYLERLRDGTLSRDQVRRMGFPWSEALVVRSRLAVQGTINAALWALEDGAAANLAGGTHHAYPDHGQGFCVLNDVAVAIRVLQSRGLIERALVVDLDVHQGNGTAKIFESDDSVFTFSVHGARNFPVRKERSDLDVPLEDGAGDDAYMAALEANLPVAIERARADVAFYLGGVDVLAGDKFGRLSLSESGIARRDRCALRALSESTPAVVLLLSGGYAESPRRTAELHAIMHREAKALGLGGRRARPAGEKTSA